MKSALPDPPVRAYRKEMVKTESAVGAYTCPTCKQSVQSAVHRHKTLGVVVPTWGPGPCQNRDCVSYRLEPDRKPPRTP